MTLAVEPGRIVGLAWPQRQRQGARRPPSSCSQRPAPAPDAGEIWVDGHQTGEGEPCRGLLSARTQQPAPVDDGGPDSRISMRTSSLTSSASAARRCWINWRSHPSKAQQMSKGTREKVQLILTMSRQAKLYLLDEPIGGVDPAARDYILDTIIRNYDPEAAVILSTHLIADVERILDEVIFVNQGQVLFQSTVDAIREEKGKSVDALFREVYKC
ncbi:MAG: AAA family ATPase [Evtepia sp.]